MIPHTPSDLGLFSPDSGADGDTGRISPHLEKLVTETHGAALLTAAMASIANVLREPGVARSPAELQMYLPNPSGMIFGVRVLSREAQLSVRTHAAISAFYAGLEPALRETDRYFADANVLGVERGAALHQFSLANGWRLVAQSAADAVEELSIETDEALPELYGLSAGILSRLLNAAARGQSPCIDINGKPFLPALPQRRRAARRTLGQSASISINGRSVRAYVRDVSQGGMGLEQAGKLPIGAIATIVLSSGRRFTGAIVWNKGSRAGVRFTIPLTPNDPLLWG